MKFLVKLLFCFGIIFLIPLNVIAGEKVNVYVFYSDDSTYCDELFNTLSNVSKDTYDKFNIKSFEVINNKNNINLMNEIVGLRDDRIEHLPYLIIGNQSWEGFDQDYIESIYEKINSEYEISISDRYDIMNYINYSKLENNDSDISSFSIYFLFILFFVIAILFLVFLFYRKKIKSAN